MTKARDLANLISSGNIFGDGAVTASEVTGLASSATIDTTNAGNITSGTFSAARLPAFSGDATSVAGTSQLTLANSGVTSGTYGSSTAVPVVTVDAKGRVTGVTTSAISGSLTFTGDVTGSGTTGSSTALTLANSGVTAGTYTKVTVDAKGRATSGTTLSASDIPSLDASKITSGVIDAARLPSYVDDVLEFASLASFPATGESGKIYLALDTNKAYRWSGSAYVYITSGAVDSVAGKTGVVTLTNADVGLANVENKSSATIRGELTSGNVTTALGFTPYNSTNPSGYITSSALSPYLTTATASSTYLPLSGGALTGSLTGTNILGTRFIPAPYSNVNDNVNNAPWYGLGATSTDLHGSGGVQVHLAGYYGLRFRTASATLDMYMGSAYYSSTFNAVTLQNNGNQVLHAGNYNSYSPSLTGSGASGTWGINITGNANTASYAIWSNVTNFTTASAGWYRVATTGGDGRGTYNVELHTTGGNHNPAILQICAQGDWGYDKIVYANWDGSFPANAVRITRSATNTFLEVYFTVAIVGAAIRINRTGFDNGISAYTGSLPAGGDTVQDTLTINSKINASSISVSGSTVLNAGNYSSYALPLTGGTLTGNLNMGAQVINFGGQSDSLGYNSVSGLGMYIKGTSSTYVYGGGSFYDGSAHRTILHAGNYSSYALPLTGGGLTGPTTLTAGHGDTRFQLKFNYSGDTNSIYSGSLLLWVSEPGISYAFSGIGANINNGGQYYGRQATGQAYGVYIRFNTEAGETQFWNTTGTPGTISGQGTQRAHLTADGQLYLANSAYLALHTGNYSSYALPLSGGTLTGLLNGTAARLTSDGSSRALYLRGSGNIIQFEDAAGTFKWELVGRDGQFYIYKNDGTGSGYKWLIDGSGNHSVTGAVTITGGSSQPLSISTSSGSPWGFGLVRTDTGANSRVFLHNPGSGSAWIFEHLPYFYNGGAYNVPLHNGNYNSYSPTLTGGGASGNWSGISVNRIASRDIRTIAPNSENSGELRFGFTSWNNNNTDPWADYLHLRSYTDASGGSDNLIMFRKSGIGMRIWQQSWGSSTAYATSVDVLHSSNYSSYAVPLSGGTMTGRLTTTAWTTSGRNYSNEWIEFSNYSGLYSPNNGAHFYPNNGTYGGWRAAGSRNGWHGIEFDASNGQVVLMINPDSNTSGFHNNNYGWQMRWNNGVGYIYKNAYGGGTAAVILDSVNYTDYITPADSGPSFSAF